MEEMTAFERQLAAEMRGMVGPLPRFDVAAIAGSAATTSPKWRFQSMFSATKFVVAGAIVALFGGFLLAGVLTQPSEEAVPGAATDDGPMAPVMFTMRLGQPHVGDDGTTSATDEGHTLVTGYTDFALVVDPTDPRMSGVYTAERNWIERDDGYPDLETILYEIKNEGGRWIGTSHRVWMCSGVCDDSPAADLPATHTIVFTGMDGYEGLTAYVVASNGWTAGGRTVLRGADALIDPGAMVGLIVPGEMPPVYDLPVSSCPEQHSEWCEEVGF